jgi:hypothetical protein
LKNTGAENFTIGSFTDFYHRFHQSNSSILS